MNDLAGMNGKMNGVPGWRTIGKQSKEAQPKEIPGTSNNPWDKIHRSSPSRRCRWRWNSESCSNNRGRLAHIMRFMGKLCVDIMWHAYLPHRGGEAAAESSAPTEWAQQLVQWMLQGQVEA